MLDLVRNPEDRFPRVAAHLKGTPALTSMSSNPCHAAQFLYDLTLAMLPSFCMMSEVYQILCAIKIWDKIIPRTRLEYCMRTDTRKPGLCVCENKDANNCTADQHFCFFAAHRLYNVVSS